MADPNFLHIEDHVHLGPRWQAHEGTNPAVNLQELPPIDVVLLSQYRTDHLDQDVETSLRRNLPIIMTTHSHLYLTSKGDGGELHSRTRCRKLGQHVRRCMSTNNNKPGPFDYVGTPIPMSIRNPTSPGRGSYTRDSSISKANDLTTRHCATNEQLDAGAGLHLPGASELVQQSVSTELLVVISSFFRRVFCVLAMKPLVEIEELPLSCHDILSYCIPRGRC